MRLVELWLVAHCHDRRERFEGARRARLLVSAERPNRHGAALFRR
jgi:hypothetical protein